jgi:hypothetical protein
MDAWLCSLPGVDTSQAIGNLAGSLNVAQIPNELSWGSNGTIVPGWMQSPPFGGELPNRSSLSALPELFSGVGDQIATEGLPTAAKDKTVTVQYDTIDEAKQALVEAKKKTLEKLQSIEQQIEKLEEMKRSSNKVAGDLESLESGLF